MAAMNGCRLLLLISLLIFCMLAQSVNAELEIKSCHNGVCTISGASFTNGGNWLIWIGVAAIGFILRPAQALNLGM
uniref:Uncharacterized protein n=1 Tax=Panagrolaimus sp. ES5 TaxID=591445 RepID=A0AC34F1I5_9BILA